ncbi:MAG: DUF6249 domain-containing protein [Pseudomonadota bacterium]
MRLIIVNAFEPLATHLDASAENYFGLHPNRVSTGSLIQQMSEALLMGDDIIAFVPVFLAIIIVSIPITAQYFGYRRRKASLDLMRDLLASRDTLDEPVLNAISRESDRPDRDLRRGALFLAFAISGFVFSFALTPQEGRYVFRLACIFPCILGLTYLAFHFLLNRTDDE